MKPVRTINYVARHTGLSIHAIRVWEKRYGAVKPVRSDNNRRLYDEEDVQRLSLLRELTQAGHSIGQIAREPLPALQRLAQEAGRPLLKARGHREQVVADAAEDFIARATELITAFDAAGLPKLLERAAVELGSPAVLQRFIAPLAEEIGQLWRKGEITIAHEHFASAAISEFLTTFARPYSPHSTAGHLVIATPPGQYHELGAILVAAAARSHGWRATYLGVAMPIQEIVGALRALKPTAVGLSLVFPPDDQLLRRDLRELRELLPAKMPLLIGGRAANGYRDLLRTIDAIYIEKLDELYPVLEKLQQAPRKRAAKAK